MSKNTMIGINGCGRIGRKILRLAFSTPGIEVAAVNDTGDLPTLAHLLKHDSVHGRWNADIQIDGTNLVINGKKVHVFSDRDPSKLNWGQFGVQIVHECTGAFTDKAKAAVHLNNGVKKVLISAPSKDADITLVAGVNLEAYRAADHHIISNASCTTNCLAPVAKVIDENFKILKGTMLTVHSYTNDQRILDLPHKDLRRARAAALSMIPTSTGAAKAVGLVLPHLKGKLDGLSIRVPTPNVSMVDLTVQLEKPATKEAINTALETASKGALLNILGFEKAPLVSNDFNGDVRSSIVDAELTMVMDGNFAKVIAWYDNESGFSQRMLDVTRFLGEKGL